MHRKEWEVSHIRASCLQHHTASCSHFIKGEKVTELAPRMWSRSIFFLKSGDYAPHLLLKWRADKSDASLWASPLTAPRGSNTDL